MNNIVQIPTQKNLDFNYGIYLKCYGRAIQTRNLTDIASASRKQYAHEILCARVKKVLGIS